MQKPLLLFLLHYNLKDHQSLFMFNPVGDMT